MKKLPWSFIIIFLVALVFVGIFILPKYPSINENGLSAFVTQGDGSNPFYVDISVVPPSLNDDYQGLILRIDQLSYSSQNNEMAQKTFEVCVDEIYILFSGYSQVTPGGNEQIKYDLANRTGSLCKPLKFEYEIFHTSLFSQTNENTIHLGTFSYVTEDINNLTSYPYLENYRYFYPYDGFMFSLGVLLKYRLLSNEGKVIDSGITVPFTAIKGEIGTSWNSKQNNPDPDFINIFQILSTGSDSEYYKVAQNSLSSPYPISYSRPMVIRIVYPILLLSLIAFIAFLSTVKKASTFTEGAVAILFGIYGIHSIVLPSDTKVQTLVDVAILGLYITFATAVLIQVIRYIGSYLKEPKAESSTISHYIVQKQKTSMRRHNIIRNKKK